MTPPLPTPHNLGWSPSQLGRLRASPGRGRGEPQDPQEGGGSRELSGAKGRGAGGRLPGTAESRKSRFKCFQASVCPRRATWVAVEGSPGWRWRVPVGWGAASAWTHKAPQGQELPTHWAAAWEGPDGWGLLTLNSKKLHSTKPAAEWQRRAWKTHMASAKHQGQSVNPTTRK